MHWSSERTLESLWCFEMKASAEEIWTALSDTSRFNRELGLAPRIQVEKEGQLFVTTRMLGLKQEWIEEPWNWLTQKTICSVRTYIRGIAKTVQAVFHVVDEGERRRVYIYFGWQPAHSLWGIFLRATEPYLKSCFRKNFAKIDLHIQSEKKSESAFVVPALPLTEDKQQHLEEIQKRLRSKNLNPDLVQRLCSYVVQADEMDLESIRLVPLAQKWNDELRELVVVSLHATRLGLLNISWKIICPHCRGSRFSAGRLGEIPESADCAVCDVQFSTSNAESIEIIFHVHPSVRDVKEQIYCAAEPAKKNHIKVQQVVEPGSTFSVQVDLKVGFFRARFQEKKWNFEVTEKSITENLDFNQLNNEAKVGTKIALYFKNESSERSLFVIEELWGQSSALKPAYLLSLWEFRDLFSEEHLNAKVKLYLGEQTILFTDIVNSTRFYQKVGDAKAFSEVHAHFQDIAMEVKSAQGVVVKTIGDSVMASFASVDDALRSAVKIQERFQLSRKDTDIRLRISINSGLVIAVQLNSGIDYFGNTVNLAAKIQTCAQAGEIALSESTYGALKVNPLKAFNFPLEKRKNWRDSDEAMDVYILRVDPIFEERKSS